MLVKQLLYNSLMAHDRCVWERDNNDDVVGRGGNGRGAAVGDPTPHQDHLGPFIQENKVNLSLASICQVTTDAAADDDDDEAAAAGST